MRFSVVIPTLNEAAQLESTVARVRATSGGAECEVIVVDGGSTDGTWELAGRCADAVLAPGQTGRARQLHAGASAASGDMILFLHADSRLPEGWGEVIRQVFAAPRPPAAAAFTKVFDHPAPAYRLIERVSALRGRLTGVPHGDQALAVPRDIYIRCGGYPPVELMEEYHLARRLRALGRIRFLPQEIVVSARRYQKTGPFRQALRNALIVLLHYAGVPARQLARLYRSGLWRRAGALVLFAWAPGAGLAGFDASHAAFDRVLKRHVRNGRVDYRALKKDPRDLDAYLQGVAAVPAAQYESWDAAARVAFWVNAYNALTLKSVAARHPVKSIRDIPGVWKKKDHVVAGRRLSLDDIEHDILRKEFDEPRIHMALVCAAHSCPPLAAEAYTGGRLEAQLEERSRLFVGDPAHVRIDRAGGTVFLSAIFDWFGGDFVRRHPAAAGTADKPANIRAVLAFVARYMSAADRAYIESGRYRVVFLDYDWALNAAAP